MGLLVFAIGFLSLTAQVLLLRELAVLCHGTEMAFSAALAAWLLLVAAGSFIAAHVVDRVRRAPLAFTLGGLAVGVLVPLTVLWVRAAPLVFLPATGAAPSLRAMVLLPLLLLAPLCPLLGFVFALACRMAADARGAADRSIGRVYVLETLGAIAGGVTFTFLLARLAPSWTTALGVGLAGAVVALVTWWRRLPRARLFMAPGVLVAAGLLVGLLPPYRQVIELGSRALRYREGVLVETRDSVYGRIDVTLRHGQAAYYMNGELVAASGAARR